MELSLENPVVQLCMDGMRAEGEGKVGEARDLFGKAWDARRDAYDACVAAHFVARHQESTADALRWNEEALMQAGLVEPTRVRTFLPSLYLNLGRSHEVLGDLVHARRYYDLAAGHLGMLADDPYGAIVRGGVADALRRVSGGADR